jgi:hypothetical protein
MEARVIEPQDLSDQPWGRGLPDAVIDLLIDLGETTNEAVFLLNEALLIDRRVATGHCDERSTGRPGNARLRMRDRAKSVMLNYSDEMVAVYADAAASTPVLRDLSHASWPSAARSTWWSLPPLPMSVIITDPGTYLPWTEVGSVTPASQGLQERRGDRDDRLAMLSAEVGVHAGMERLR